MTYGWQVPRKLTYGIIINYDWFLDYKDYRRPPSIYNFRHILCTVN